MKRNKNKNKKPNKNKMSDKFQQYLDATLMDTIHKLFSCTVCGRGGAVTRCYLCDPFAKTIKQREEEEKKKRRRKTH